MNKSTAMAAILKFINGRNDSRQYLNDIHEYITAPSKTNNGRYIATRGCSHNRPIEDFIATKKLHNNSNGKQGEHFVLSFPPNGSQKSPTEILAITVEILDAVYPEYQSVSAYHADSNVPHTHSILNSVNSITGRKVSQSPSDLNRVKQKVNNILKKHGFEIITVSANDFVDRTDYSDVEGFDFLELDETELITESDIEEISPYTDTISGDSPLKIFCGQDYSDCCSTNYFGGYNTMNTNNYVSCAPQTQELPASTIETVPATVEMPKNSYPNTTVVTGPTFRIKGTPQSDLAGLGGLVEQTSTYAAKHQIEAANLAYAMQKKSQDNGYPTNVSVIAGPIFDIDLTGSLMNAPVPDIADLDFDDN